MLPTGIGSGSGGGGSIDPGNEVRLYCCMNWAVVPLKRLRLMLAHCLRQRAWVATP
jgi:hypothetical protein